MTHPVEKLRVICARCRAGIQLGDEEMRWLVAGLDRFLSRQSRTLDQALGIVGLRGGIPWWMEEAIRTRDAALRELAALVCPQGSAQARARAVRNLCLRYAATAWRFDRAQQAMPGTYCDKPRALLWQAFKSEAAMPVSERHLRSILAAAA